MLKRRGRKTEKTDVVEARQFVSFRVGGELYGTDIHSVQEIDRMHSITKLPKALPFIEGVINLRGSIIPVIDMGKRFGLAPVKAGRQTRIIIVRLTGQSVGLIVEQVNEVVQIGDEEIEPAPAMAFAVDQKYVGGVGRISSGLIILLNVDLLLSSEEMTQLQQQHLS